jgi:hypothetical protein
MYNNDHEVELPSERRRRAEMFEEPEEHHTIRWIVIAIVAAAFIGLGWYTSDALTRLPAIPATLAQFPRLQTSFAELHTRVTDTEAKLQGWLAGQQELQQNVTDLQKQVESRFQAVRQQARAMSAEVYKGVHAEIAAQTQGMQTRLTRLESTSEAEQTRVEKLQTELAVLRQETARQAEQLRGVRDQIEHDGASHDQQLVSLNQRLSDESRDVDGLAKKLEVKRVDFEVTKNRSQQLAVGVSLGITGTDVSHRRVNGWMWVMPDRRTVWLRGQGAQQPVVFYGYHDSKRRELVITNVSKNSVSGYLLLPADNDSNTSASLTKTGSRLDR